MIYKLHKLKSYKHETLFRAVSILDRYLTKTYDTAIPSDMELRHLPFVSLLIAAKLEETVSPSFSRMVGLLGEEKRSGISIEHLFDLETHMLT